jgi:hypothetical protein
MSDMVFVSIRYRRELQFLLGEQVLARLLSDYSLGA